MSQLNRTYLPSSYAVVHIVRVRLFLKKFSFYRIIPNRSTVKIRCLLSKKLQEKCNKKNNTILILLFFKLVISNKLV